jgi:flavin reductase (DIM6/NTAB) family NADH-FMN oxidoreductase RutF
MPSSHDAPPVTLDCPLEVGPDDWRAPGFYQLLTALVVPRPIGWISTISESGVRNVAPYSYFNLMGSDPPYVAFGSTGIKDSLRNLCEVPEFVANIVTMHLLERMNFTSGDFPHEENEFDWACLTPAPSAKVRPFRVAEAKAHLECEVAQIVTDRNTNIVLGRIVHAHVDPSVWKNGRSTRNCSILSAVCLAPVMRHSAIWSTSSARNGKTSRAPQAWTRCRGRNGGSAASGSLPGSIRQSATTMLSVPGDRTFESISLQR